MTQDIVKSRVHKYFDQEKKAGFLFIGFAVICMITTYLTEGLLSKTLSIGIMTPLRILSFIQFIVGIECVFTNSKKEKEWENIATENRFTFLTCERKRVKRIDGGLKKLENIFMLLILLGFVFLLLGFIAKWGDLAIGTGIGLLVASAIIYLINLYRAFNVGTHLNYLNTRPK